MDKKEYKSILDAVKTNSGNKVEFVGDANGKGKKDAKTKEGNVSG
jgi:hypothetical protein